MARFYFLQMLRGGQIQESRENYYSNSTAKEKGKFANSKFREKFQNQKFVKI